MRRRNITLRLLGGWQLEIDDTPTQGPAYEKGRALLAYLATEPRWHSREALGQMFWPDSPGSRANLRQVMSNLKGILGDQASDVPCIEANRNSIRINPESDLWVDVAAFSPIFEDCTGSTSTQQCHPCLGQLEQTADLYRGEFLDRLELSDCPDFNDWLGVRRESLRRQAIARFQRLADCHGRAGNWLRALQFAHRWEGLDPYADEPQRCLMQLYAASGQTAIALRQFKTFTRHLEQELGGAPDAATVALYEQIRAGEHEPPPHIRPEPEAARQPSERRQLTALYCEIAAAGNDPEDIAAMKQEPMRRAIKLIRLNGGYLVPSHDGGLLAYFGYPLAQENATLLAVRTAFALSRLDGMDTAIRAGVQTGMAVIGPDPAMPDIAGLVSGTAIRLCQSFRTARVVLGAAARDLVAGYFSFDRLGTLPDPHTGIDAFELQAESGAATRLEAASRLSPLVGREVEMARLAEMWRGAERNINGCAILIRGEAGIGKSRLLKAFRESCGIGPETVWELRCLPEYRGSALHPVSDCLARACGFTAHDDKDARREKFEAYFAGNHPELSDEALALIGRLLAVAGDATALAALPPQQVRDLTSVALIGVLATPNALLVVEDLHWADPSTLELLDALLKRREAPHPFVLMTARHEFGCDWQVEHLNLDPLSAWESVALVESIGRERGMSPADVTRIVAATDGVPLYIEEMAHMLLNRRDAAVPGSLQDLLAARLDQLGRYKRLAQLAAVIGREFDVELLQAASSAAYPADLEAGLDALEQAGLVQIGPDADMLNCRFKHALIVDAAYHSLTRADRRDAHLKVARALEARIDRHGDAPERLAFHYDEAGKTEKAIGWWLIAGKQAALQCAHAEATAHFNRALAALAGLRPTPGCDDLELEILVELGSTLISNKGYGSPEADQVYRRAMSLTGKTGVSLALFRSLWGLYLGSSSRTHHQDSMKIAERLLELAKQDGAPPLLIASHYACTNSAYSLGRFDEAIQHLEAARTLYRPELDDDIVALFGEQVMVTGLLFGALSYWITGRSADSLERANEAMAIAERIDHPYTLCLAYSLSGMYFHMRPDIERVDGCAAALSALAAEQGYDFMVVVGGMLEGWAQAARGEAEGAARIAVTVGRLRQGQHFNGIVMYFLEMLVDAYRLLGQAEALVRSADEAIEVMKTLRDIHFEAEFYRLKGHGLLNCRQANPKEAEECFMRALTVSRLQNAKWLELRAANDLAQLWLRQGKREQAIALLQESCGERSDGELEFPDLSHARSLLLELEAV